MLKKTFLITLALSLFNATAFADDAGLHYPHYEINNIGCLSCHYQVTDSLPDWLTHEPQDIDDTPYNNLCRSCHNDVIAPNVNPHSSLTTSNQYHQDEGGWAIECRECHWPHHQLQAVAYGSDSYLYSGVSTDVTATTLTETGAGWNDDQFNNNILIPDINQPSFNYRITDTTSDTLTVETSGSHPEPIDLASTSVGDTFAIIYGKLIRTFIPTPNSGYKQVSFFTNSGPNSYADGDATYDGVCEVCHTEANHFRNTGETNAVQINVGDGVYDHTSVVGTNCINCHSHTAGFSHGMGVGGGGGGNCEECHGHDAGYAGFTGGKGSYVPHSTHTEDDSDDIKGPNVSCNECHDTDNFPYFKSGTDSNGNGVITLDETDVCNTCHSPNGSYDGVNDAAVGAKNNWHTAIYEADSLTLQAGKEKWCATCHDEDPSVIQSIAAPNAVGDEGGAYTYGNGWGFYKTGHGLDKSDTYPASGGLVQGAGKDCLDCHDTSQGHIDGKARSFDCTDDDPDDGEVDNNDCDSDEYRQSYRLQLVDDQDPMTMPPAWAPAATKENFRLCFSSPGCHMQEKYLLTETTYGTNFRDDSGWLPGTDHPVNAHELHLHNAGMGTRFRPDWRSTSVGSSVSCVNCHNVHGSIRLAMIRDGKLTDREPGIKILYTTEEQVAPDYLALGPIQAAPVFAEQPLTLADSTGTFWDSDTSDNVCSDCHGQANGGGYIYPRTSPPLAQEPPTLSWTGETGYETDGVNPTSAQSGSYFFFRVNYTDANFDLPVAIQLWVDADDSGSYEESEKYDLYEVDTSDRNCSDGKLYNQTMAINFAGDGTLMYRFYAIDRNNEATGDAATGGTITLSQSVPELTWSGEQGYTADGVNPDSGASGSSFVFRIDYSHADNVPPTSIQVWVDVDDSDSYEADEKFEMTAVDAGDTSYTDGKLYSWASTLSHAGDGLLNYRFYTSDGTIDAIGTPTSDRSLTVTNGNTAPVLSWTGASNYVTDGVDPDSGIDNTSFTFQVQYSDAENTPPSFIQVWVDMNDDDDYDDSGEKIDLTAVDGADIDYSNGKIYEASTTLSAVGDGIINYRFSASDGALDATGTPAQDSIVTLLVDALMVSCDGTGDYDYTSLQEAITDATDGDTILLASGTCTGNIVIDNKDLTIVSASGAGSTFIDGNDSGRTLIIENGADILLNGVTVQNGSISSGYGAGIYISDSSPTIINSIVTANNSSQYGAGIYVSGASSTVTISDTTVINNTCGLSGPGIFIASGSSAVISDSTITNNTSSNGYGGGIFMGTSTDASLAISNSIISENSVTYRGGGVYCAASGGTVSVSIDNTTLSDNNVGQYGGAVYIESSGATLTGTITDSTISSNTANLAGGGLYLLDLDSMTITGSTFNDNSSVNGGALFVANGESDTFTITDSTIRDNTGIDASYGGGMRLSGGTANFERCFVTGNSARQGGGFYISGNTTASFVNCVVTGNNSYNFGGGGFYITGNNAVLVADIMNSTISGNNAVTEGGGVEVLYDATATVTLTNSIIYGNGGSSQISGTVIADHSDIGEDGYSGNNNINVDPLFVDPRSFSIAPTSEGDYHLQFSSQAVDNGTSVGAPAVDIDNHIRPNGAGIDMGADEAMIVFNTTPSLEWTSETGYVADGADPDQGVSGTDFEFRINYIDADNDAPTLIELWVDENDNNSYEAGEKYAMNVVDGGDTTYTDGKLYTKTLNLVSSGDNVLNYRFYAADTYAVASGEPVSDNSISLISVPELTWLGSADYVADGVNPDSGLSGSDFVFRVSYTSADNTPPTSIQVWVDRNDDGDYVDSGEKLSMTALSSADTDYTDGKIYTKTVALTMAGDNTLNYRFYAASGVAAIGDPTTVINTVGLFNNIPTLAWTGLTNYTEDGVDPDNDFGGSTYDFRVEYTDADNEAPASIQLWLDKNDDGDYLDANEKIDMSSVDPGDSTYSDGKLYKVVTSLDAAGDGVLNYSFRAGDGTDTATGTPTSDFTVGVFAASPVPELDWTGESGYSADGVDPDSGPGGGVYTFRVKYTQLLNDPPVTIQVWVDKNDDGDYLDSDEKIDMSAVDGGDTTYSDGKLYTVATTVSYVADGSVSYLFYAFDGTSDATGAAVVAQTLTVADAIEVPAEEATIQGAIDAAADGQYILVADGIFDENIIFPADKSVTVQSVNGAEFTTIQGSGANAAVVTISSGESYSEVLDGFTIDNQGHDSFTRGIYVLNLSAPTIKNCILQGNSSTSGSGGGLYLKGASSTYATTVTNTTVTSNTVGGGGAGIYCLNSKLVLSNSIVSNNTSTFDGTGVALTGAATTATINSSTFTGNQGRNGVALYANGTGALTISDSTFDTNTGTVGAGLYVTGMAGATTMSNVIVSNNTSGSNAGGIFFSSAGTSLIITGSTINNNAVTLYDGGGLYINGDATTSATITDVIISNNESRNGAGIYMIGGPALIANNVDIFDNQARTTGGGISVGASCTLDIRGSYIRGNKAGAGGGGINNSGNVTLTNCIISGNSADVQSYSDGGGINSYIAPVNVYNSTISGNYAKRNGGGLRVSDTSTIINSVIWGNTADSSGPDISGAPTVTYSDVQGGYAGTGNIDANPRFVDFQQATLGSPTSDGVFLLCNGVDDPAGCTNVSPCIDSASGNFAPDGDIEGNSRPYDVEGTDDGIDDYDMGADEYRPASAAFDTTTAGTATASVAGATSIDISMPYTDDQNGDNTYTVDYKLSSESTVWTNWVTEAVHAASPYSDTLSGLTADESYDVRLTYLDADGVNGTAEQTVSDIDLTLYVDLSAASQTVAEDVGAVTVTATLTRISDVDVTVPFIVSGTATAGGTDHNLADGNIIITAGQLTGTTDFTVTDDSLDESDETVIVTMGTPVNATTGTIDVHTVTITDNDEALPTVTFSSASQATADESGTATITVELSAVSGSDVTVPFTINGSSTADGEGTDYSITVSPVTITAGNTSVDITVTVTTDSDVEGNETVVIDMGSPTNATQGATTTHTVTITDDDAALPSVSFSSSSQSTADESGTATINVELSAVSGSDVTVPFTVNGSSTATGGGTDYSITASPVTITAGNTSVDITVTVITDSDIEGDETVIVDMGSPTNATQGATTTHTVTITDDDSASGATYTVCPGGHADAPCDYETINAGIDDGAVVDGDTLLVSADTYSENINYDGKDITIQSAGGAASTIIEGDGSNAPVVTFGSAETASAVLDGFTINNQNDSGANHGNGGIKITASATPTIKNSVIKGNDLSAWSADGAGIYISGGGVTVESCTIGVSGTPNIARYGAGIYAINSILDVTITGCTITYNQGINAGGAIYMSNMTGTNTITNTSLSNNAVSNDAGGGIYMINMATANTTIIGCTIDDNTASKGAGIHSSGSPFTMSNTSVDNNISSNEGGGIRLDGDGADAVISGGSVNGNSASHGAGFYLMNGSDLTYTNGSISGNIGVGASLGGGIYDGHAGTELILTKMYIQGNKSVQHGGGIKLAADSTATITNSIITGNAAGSGTWEDGGGICSNGTLNVYSSTIAGNYAGQGGGIHIAAGTAVVTNSIIWDNTAGDGSSHQIYGSPAVTYSDVEGSFSGTGNVNDDPLFTTPAQASAGTPTSSGLFTLEAGSGAIDVGGGVDDIEPDPPIDDIEGNSRPQGSGYDMGADEYM